MSTTRFATIIGLVIGAVWALTGFGGAVLSGLSAAVGFLVGQVLTGRIDLNEYVGRRQP
jgi:hypothetical protein